MTAVAQAWEADGVTFRLSLAGAEFYLILADGSASGTCVSVAIRASKMGSSVYGNLVALAGQISRRFETGEALDAVIDDLLGLAYEPRGLVTGHPRVTWAESFSDLLGRCLADRYVWPAVVVGIFEELARVAGGHDLSA